METFDAQTLGTIAALQVAVQSLLKAHPEPGRVHALMLAEQEPTKAVWLGGATPEAALQSFDTQMEVFLAILAKIP
jgi:alpha-D-ribose 1-methylphosphonate 5-triphosphate synthase subunit PhnH